RGEPRIFPLLIFLILSIHSSEKPQVVIGKPLVSKLCFVPFIPAEFSRQHEKVPCIGSNKADLTHMRSHIYCSPSIIGSVILGKRSDLKRSHSRISRRTVTKYPCHASHHMIKDVAVKKPVACF